VIILDTNVISELMRGDPDRLVAAWLDTQPVSKLATTTINLAEVKYGLACLLPGRRHDLERRFDSFAAHGFASRVFDFDAAAADVYGDVAAARRRAGRPLGGFDGLIAAIARSRGLPIATRNVDDFVNCGLTLINPWLAASSGG
jgi:hypothetical protein